MSREEIVALFTRRDEAWRRHDAAALSSSHAPDAIGESPMSGKLVGRDSIREIYEKWFTAFPDLTMSLALLRNLLQVRWSNAKDIVWCSGSRPDDVERVKVRIHQHTCGSAVCERRNTADGVAGESLHGVGVRAHHAAANDRPQLFQGYALRS